jgi:hypothetical protein
MHQCFTFFRLQAPRLDFLHYMRKFLTFCILYAPIFYVFILYIRKPNLKIYSFKCVILYSHVTDYTCHDTDCNQKTESHISSFFTQHKKNLYLPFHRLQYHSRIFLILSLMSVKETFPISPK